MIENLAGVMERVDGCVRERMVADDIPSMVVALTDREGLLHAAAYGHADIGRQTPATIEPVS